MFFYLQFVFSGSVLLTPFKQVIIPPPMFDVKLTIDSPVDSVVYMPHNKRQDMFVLVKMLFIFIKHVIKK